MSASPIGKNRKAMWQSMVLSIINKLHSDDTRPDIIRASMNRVAVEADFLLDEMEKRFSLPEKPTTTLTLKR